VRTLTWSTAKGDAWLYPKIEELYRRVGGKARECFPTVKFWSTELYATEEEAQEISASPTDVHKKRNERSINRMAGSADLDALKLRAALLKEMREDASDGSPWAAFVPEWATLGEVERKKGAKKAKKKAWGAVKAAAQQAAGKRETRQQQTAAASEQLRCQGGSAKEPLNEPLKEPLDDLPGDETRQNINQRRTLVAGDVGFTTGVV
jgi:hypothetical protein